MVCEEHGGCLLWVAVREQNLSICLFLFKDRSDAHETKIAYMFIAFTTIDLC